MANQKILDRKKETIDEISSIVKNSTSFIAFEYQGLTVSETMELRKKLREKNAELKIYKNTLVNRALKSLDIDLDADLNGPKAFAFGDDAIAPVKVLNDFSKTHPALELKVGIVDGNITRIEMLKELASIPSKEALLTMFAGGLIEHVRNLAICLDLHSQNLEK